jgi:hypothetical protein
MTTTADDTNDKLTITASNNQETGYVTGANKTATKTVTLTASGATVTASDGSKSISKSVATATQATPSVSVNSSGLITASATQSEGYVTAGTKSATKQLTTQGAKTITPSTSSQTAVASGVYTTGAITVKGDANLVAGNIKSGISIFGVSGSYEGSGGSSGGSGSSGTLETCSVQLTIPKSYNLVYFYVENGEICCKTLYYPMVLNNTLSNVVKGSFMVIGKSSASKSAMTSTLTGNVEMVTGTTSSQPSYSVGNVYKINGDCSITITE